MILRNLKNTGVLLLVLLLSWQCKKDHSILGVDVQPESDFLGAQVGTNFPVYAHTVRYDSIPSLNTGLKFLGFNDDPAFGTTSVGLYLNANMSLSDLTFGPNPTLVSAEIILAVANERFVGTNTAQLNYSVFPIDVALDPKKVYYTSNNRLHRASEVIGTSITGFTTINGKQAIKIPLNASYATAIITNTQHLVNNDKFQAEYKGFYIYANSGSLDGIIYECDLDNSLSGLKITYKNGTDTSDFTFSFSGASSTKFNTVKFNPYSSLYAQLNGDTALGAQNLYLKGMGVTKLKVQIPFLKHSDTFNISVSRAEVIFNVDPSFMLSTKDKTRQYEEPLKLALMPLDSLGREIFSIDQRSVNYISRYHGEYDSEKKHYVFNIPLHAQAIFKGQRKNYGFALVVADPTPPYTIRRDNYIERVVLGGSGTAINPVLNLSYTRFTED